MQPTGLTLVTAPAEEPITLAEAKSNARADAELTALDPEVNRQIAAARSAFELKTGRALLTQTWRASYDRFPYAQDWFYTGSSGSRGELHLPRPPLQSVTSIQYVDTGGTTQTLDASEYQVDAESFPGRVMPAYTKVWPATRRVYNAVQITFVAGYTTPSLVPADIREWLFATVAFLLKNKGDMPVAIPPQLNWFMEDRWTGNYA